MKTRLFTLLVISAVLIAFAGNAMAASYTTRMFGYGNLFDENHTKSQGWLGRPVIIRTDGAGNDTRKAVFKFDFDLTDGSYNAFAYRGLVTSVSNIQIIDNRHRDTSGAPVLDIYLLNKEVAVNDFQTSGDPLDPNYENPNNVTWNHAAAGNNWETPGATGASDRYATALFDNYAVTNEYPTFNLDVWVNTVLMDALNNGGNLAILYELDATSPSGNFFKDQHYAPMKITFDYTIVPEPSTIALCGMAALALLRRKK